MTTATPEPPPSGPKSWRELVARGHQEAPPELDVRVSVRAVLAAKSGREAQTLATPSDLWEDLQALARLPLLRLTLAGGSLAALVLCLAGTRALSELQDVAQFAAPLLAGL
jgi:hypothetical protein